MSAGRQRILLVGPNRVGDLVMATPTFLAIRETFPEAEITLMVRGGLAELMEPTPWFDGMMAGQGRGEGIRALFKTAKEIRKRKFDVAVLFPNSFRTALLAKLGRCRRVVGYKRDGRSWLLSDGPKPRKEAGRYVPVPAIDYYLELAATLGVKTTNRRMELFVSEADRAKGGDVLEKAGLAGRKPLVLLSPGASYGPSKCWPVERFAHTAEILAEKTGAGVGIICAGSEIEAAREIVKRAETEVKIIGEGKLGLGALKGVVERADVVITNDTGSRHVAAALGRAVVTLFGPTDPTWAQIDYERESLVRVDVDCGPCQLPVCPKDHKCMTRIEPERVAAEAGRLIRGA